MTVELVGDNVVVKTVDVIDIDEIEDDSLMDCARESEEETFRPSGYPSTWNV